MFDGVPNDQFHQFIASRTSIPINPLSFPLHGNPSFSAAFDPYSSTLHSQALHQLHHQESPNSTKNNIIDGKHVEKYPLISTSLALESERSMDPWSNDEVLALFKVRSSMEIWFPDFTWEHVSRKLAELGFKRSAEQCKEKFEEESRHFNSVNHNKNYRIFSELDEFYPADNQEEARVSAGRSTQNMEKGNEADDQLKVHKNVEENSGNMAAENPSQESEEVVEKPVKLSKKRKRKDKFEMFKGFCETVVNKMMAQQEELHNKLIDDIVKRDDEKIAREEAWKNQEMNRIKMEIEMRSKEQASAAERQATIIEFLKKFTSDDQDQNLANKIDYLVNKVNNSTTSNSSTTSLCKIPQSTHHDQDNVETAHQNPPSFPSQNSPKTTKTPSPPSPSSILVTKDSKAKASTSADNESTTPVATFTTTPSSSSILDSRTNYESGDIGKRWPRDEVLALINLRCKMNNNSSSHDDSKESGAKGPLWERISQGMLELGYKRSAKRCKEKWENINKYFRKTKDCSKKRSVNSRTCPYFHQLSCLYSDGSIVAPNNMPEN